MEHLRLLVVAGILITLLVGVSCSSFESPQQSQEPTETTLQLLSMEVQELKDSNPQTIAGHNGYLVVAATLVERNIMRVILVAQVSNESSEIRYTHPSNFLLVDENGGVHSYDSSSTTFSNMYFRGIDLPSGTHTEGALIFKIDSSVSPKSLVYNDNKTPPITIPWLDGGN